MDRHFYQKTWFKNTLFISISTLISVIGIVISLVDSSTIRGSLICISIVLLLVQIYSIIRYGNEEDMIYKQSEEYKSKNDELTAILAHMENDYKTVTSEVAAFSEIAEKWVRFNKFICK